MDGGFGKPYYRLIAAQLCPFFRGIMLAQFPNHRQPSLEGFEIPLLAVRFAKLRMLGDGPAHFAPARLFRKPGLDCGHIYHRPRRDALLRYFARIGHGHPPLNFAESTRNGGHEV